MNVQIITAPTGERLVVLPEAEYQALVAAAEDASDMKTVRSFREKLASGEEELLPSEMVDRILAGESAVRVWRSHRGLTTTALAQAAGISQAYLSQIEKGARQGSTASMRKLADALNVSLDDLLG